MKETRDTLRIGWYGGLDSENVYHKPANCKKLIMHCIHEAKVALRNDEFLIGELGKSICLTELGEEDMLNNPDDRKFVENHEASDNLFVEDDCDEEIDEESDDE